MSRCSICILISIFVYAYVYGSDNPNPGNRDGNMSLQIDNSSISPEAVLWTDALERIVSKGNNLLSDCDIRLDRFIYVKTITDENISSVLKIVLNNNIVPEYDSENRICGIVTRREMNVGNNSNYVKYDFDSRDEYILRNVKAGMGLVRLNWMTNGKRYSSYCIVSDSTIVYDDFITNAIVYDTMVMDSISNEKKTKKEKTTFTGSKTWTLIATANWLWGHERGRATITHQCHYSRGRIVGQDSRASAYMSMGNSAAETTETAYNKIAYGYGLSTPLVSISISFDDGGYMVTFSSSSYSAMSGTGTHTFPNMNTITD